MKKMFSFLAAMLFAGSMMATNLFDPATTTLTLWAMPGWGTETTTFGSYDATTGVTTLTVPGDCNAQWQCQVKLNTTGITLDPAKNYEFKCKINSSAAVSNVTIKVFDNLELSLIQNLALVAGDNNYATDAFAGSAAEHNGIIVFDFGYAAANTVITISEIELAESTDTSISLSEVFNHAKGDTVLLKDFEVTYAPASDTRYYYIKDATAACVIFSKNYGLAAGDKVAKGMQAKIDIYNGLYEIIPFTAKADLTITAGTPAEPALATAAPTVDDQSKYVIYKNVRVAADTAFLSSAKNTVYGIMGNDTIMFYNSFKIAAALKADSVYNITAMNTVYNTPQALPISVETVIPAQDECAGEHGLFNVATAAINDTYFAKDGWGANPGCSAEISNGVITMHVDQAFVDMWQGQVFVNPGFTFENGKMYHYEFDIVSTGKVCITVKVNDKDDAIYFNKAIYDINIGGGTYHFSTDSVIANGELNTNRGPLVFGFGWTDANQDVIIKCIKITEVGDAPEPVVPHMYIKHPWGTGADADWTWQEMSERTYKAMDAWTYTGAWGGVGFNIADNAAGNDAKWFAAADAIEFIDAQGVLTTAPAVGTAGCEFIYVPAFDKDGSFSAAATVIVPAATGLENAAKTVKAVKVIENGQIVIIMNGVRYNALGAQL